MYTNSNVVFDTCPHKYYTWMIYLDLKLSE